MATQLDPSAQKWRVPIDRFLLAILTARVDPAAAALPLLKNPPSRAWPERAAALAERLRAGAAIRRS
jgi:hypothetical protein